jgi:hypothetical protein
MQRIGGGGVGFSLTERLRAEAVKQTGLLQRIEKNTRGGVGGMVAAYG